ncbi:MAG: DUF4783 domain-containing protein [Cytophagales bacterium]|nr:DUF4783 domain-containing protein [Bernardetiaceae bacterium]MDW8205431.1 DUF4783 domain-containing protein [Cytophagales bacterium]
MYATKLLACFFVLSLTVAALITHQAKAQAETITDAAKTAIRTGDSKELARYFNSLVELKIHDANVSKANSKDYSKTQAEYILREFFRDNPPQSFEYIHQGASREGNLRYTIGKYVCRDRNNKAVSFRVFMKLKQQNGSFVIDAIDFSKDESPENNN